MAFIRYKYGSKKKEITNLLRDRLNLQDKIRYHKMKVKEFETKLPKVEKKLNNLLDRVKGKA